MRKQLINLISNVRLGIQNKENKIHISSNTSDPLILKFLNLLIDNRIIVSFKYMGKKKLR